MTLKNRSAVVTGSTSGIGLGMARAFAAEGANVMINGFGDAAVIEKERADIEAEFKVRCLYSGADMSKGAEVTQMVRDLEFPSDTLLVAILRDSHVRVPRGSSVLEASDELVVLATPQAHAKLTGQPLPEEIGSAAPIAARPALLESARALWGRVARVLRREKT